MKPGLHTHRFAEHPEEQRIAEAWARREGSFLQYMLQPAAEHGVRRPPDPSDRDEVVAATVMQWLGSPVGQGFLRDLGYEKK